jgi:hypothetical protein
MGLWQLDLEQSQQLLAMLAARLLALAATARLRLLPMEATTAGSPRCLQPETPLVQLRQLLLAGRWMPVAALLLLLLPAPRAAMLLVVRVAELPAGVLRLP